MPTWFLNTVRHLLYGAAINLALAWSLVLLHGTPPFEWVPYFNPRPDNQQPNHPIAFFVIRRFGAEWVVGCGMPGNLVEHNPGIAATYHGEVWWPAEAVTFDMDGQCAAASGWPMLSFGSWRTTEYRETTDPLTDRDIDALRTYHWGILLADSAKGASEELPAIFPMRPIWSGLIVNTLLFAGCIAGTRAGIRRFVRYRRRNQGGCQNCGYPLTGGARCPECGELVGLEEGSHAHAPSIKA